MCGRGEITFFKKNYEFCETQRVIFCICLILSFGSSKFLESICSQSQPQPFLYFQYSTPNCRSHIILIQQDKYWLSWPMGWLCLLVSQTCKKESGITRSISIIFLFAYLQQHLQQAPLCCNIAVSLSIPVPLLK